ncbi:MAG: DUF4105 domain-containing protein [Nevskiaceae bacterium]|nr:MAG: DUF4105 domain-containing protein [Nevskiaceae bacterium]TBR73065.1 MAG: DUF4105 domain-containing protein [Nevskiaceae bacterium]
MTARLRHGPCAGGSVLATLLLAFALSAFAPSVRAASDASEATALRVSLITFGPGNVYWERFGHNALLIENRDTGAAIAYNYGIFDFSQKNFFLNFARGYMQYRIAADRWSDDLAWYLQTGRSITQQRLNLSPAQSLELARFLQWNARPENASYRYDYFLSNCSTRVRDALDRVLGGALERQLAARPAALGHTWRFDAVRALSPDTALAMAMDIALGPRADRPLNLWQESFLPDELSRALTTVQVTDTSGQTTPLVAETRVLSPGRITPLPKQPPNWLPPLLGTGLGLALILLALRAARAARMARIVFATLATGLSLGFGLLGIGHLLIWAATQHWAGWANENLLFFNPLCLLLIPAWLAAGRRSWAPVWQNRVLAVLILAMAATALALHQVPAVAQDNLAWVALALPVHAALAVCLWRATRRPFHH